MRSLRAAERAAGPIDHTLIAMHKQIAQAQRDLEQLATSAAAQHQQINDLAATTQLSNGDSEARADRLAEELQRVHLAAQAIGKQGHEALLTALWVASAPLSSHPLVSVVMPTYLPSRAGCLQSAIESVLAQSYQHLELLVVDNSDEGMLIERPPWWPKDPRVRVLRSAPHQGNVARNTALRTARGTLIAYLDDDCVWFPWWLRAAVVSLEGSPHAQFAYGVRLTGRAGPGLDSVNAVQISPLQLHLDNPVDTNSLVHRAGHNEEWDPALGSCGDYDLVVRLSAHPHVFVPIPACAYGTAAPGRVWAAEQHHLHDEDVASVRSRARQRRPLRVVAANAMYPLITETYIGDELEGLRQHGVEIVLARQQPGPTECPSAVDAPFFESLDEAISSLDPDLVLSHWAETAHWSGPIAARRGVPHAVRLHSFCAAVPDEAVYTEWCVGTWGFAHSPRIHPLARELPAMILSPCEPITDDSLRNRTIVSVSAGLPKKAWPTLIDAAAAIEDARLQVIIGRTAGWEHLADEVAALGARHGHLNSVTVDVPFAQSQLAIRSSAVLVYCVGPGVPLGQPRSIIEAALAATPLVLPDEPEMHAMVGDTAAFYTRGSTTSLTCAMRRALDQPHSMDQRLALAQRIRTVHAAPERFAQWANELTRAVVDWRSVRMPGAAAAAGRWWSQR